MKWSEIFLNNLSRYHHDIWIWKGLMLLSRFCLNGRKKEEEFRPLEVRRKLIALKKVERKLFKTHIVPCWPCKLNRFSYRRLYESNKHILNICTFFALIWKLIFKTSLTALKQNANNHRVAKITRTLLYLIYLIWYTVPVLPQKIWNLKVFSFFFKNWAKILKGILLH